MSGQGERRIAVGLERVLYLAATEPEFRAALARDVEAAVAGRGLSLGATELATLRAIPTEQLQGTIASLDTSGSNLERRTFLRAVAVSAVAVGSVSALSGCGEDEDKGPKVDQGVQAKDLGKAQDSGASRGISPDMPPPDVKVKVPDHGPAPTGIRPGG
jgi:hypothetical protein